MLTPLYFSSPPCREEMTEFLEHERSLGRGDLMLPLYFVSSPKLEKPEEQAKDPLAVEVAKRQLYDWREQALVPLKKVSSKKAMLELAGQIAERIQSAPAPRVDAAAGARAPGGATPGSKGAKPHRDVDELASDAAMEDGVDGAAARSTPAARKVLWVDDVPANNAWERRALESYGVRFELAHDTDEAMRLMETHGPFAAVVSDLGRPGDHVAGLTLLGKLQSERRALPPYFIYTSQAGTATAPAAQALGAKGVTANPDAIVRMVVEAVR
jgi:CheY-like chemotaxis protein